jgi:UDP-2,3-diacylglucosamine pyrophosphatase LpxH
MAIGVRRLAVLAFLALVVLLPGTGLAQITPGTERAERRHVVAISDLHFGLGKTASGAWDPREDFRWTNALSAFLVAIGKSAGDKVDLVIAGDFLELWQPPDSISCDGDADAMCSVDKMRHVVRHVVEQHRGDLKLLADFSKRGENRLFVVPGNHDAALLVPEVWADVAKALDVESGRVTLVTTGVWSSIDGKVVVEHGHQIGADVNAFAAWPAVTQSKGGDSFLHSPWGERFVQKLFNAEERQYPIIDNLSPESYGARLRLADRGLWGSAQDLARFLAFNLFETSVAQKSGALGGDVAAGASCTKEEAASLGYRLFAAALPANDPFKLQLEGTSPQAIALQAQLDALAKSMPDEVRMQICRQRASTPTLGAALESTFVPRQDVLRAHLEKRKTAYPAMEVFIYAHTHQLEPAWDLKLGLASSISVLNTGAFQRLVDADGYRLRVDQVGITNPSDGLSKLVLESLAPCYSFVDVPRGSASTKPVASTRLWRMQEGDKAGAMVAPGDPSCR